MSKLFDRIILLSEKTGDRVVVYEKTTDKAVVILPFERYEALVSGVVYPEAPADLTDTSLLDKINAELKDTQIAVEQVPLGEEEYLVEPAN